MIQICDLSYIPKHGFPKLSGQEGDETIVVEWEERNPILPDYNTSFYDDRYPCFGAFSDLILRKRSLEPVGVDLFRVHCEYQTNPNDGSTIVMGGGVTVECTLSNEAIDVPIEQHPNYLTMWNHDLHTNQQDETLGWALELTTTVLSEFYSPNFAWAKPGTVPAEGWRVRQSATKPGVESYRAFRPVVHATYTGRKRHLQVQAAYDGMVVVPPITFGYDNLSWLQVGSSLRRKGGLWELTTDYQGSNSIDSDLYQEPA